jgi:hypothetical protein
MAEHEEERACRRCNLPMTGSRNAEPGERKHVSRGLCSSCYYGVRTRGELDLYPLLQNNREDIVAAFVAARTADPKISQEDVAKSLGIHRTTLAMNLRRAVELGDPRVTNSGGVLDIVN